MSPCARHSIRAPDDAASQAAQVRRQLGMNARLERKLKLVGAIVVAGIVGAIGFSFAQGYTSHSAIARAISYGVILGLALGGVSQFVFEGPMRMWLGSRSFTTNLVIRSAIYAAVILPTQYFELGAVLIGQPFVPSPQGLWSGIIFTFALLMVINLTIAVANIIGPRAFLNFIVGQYHTPVEENRFVLFVDIAGSTGLAERLGGVAIHRLLDHTFRLLTLSVVDYRGEVLNYVGDEVIVTWLERDGAVDCRPLRCFVAMRDELSRASGQLEREFGAAPRIRGSLHFGPVIVGEIGDVKRAIVFNGDVMNTAARLEELSRNVDGGFLASAAAMQRFNSAPPFAIRDLGRLPIRGRADGIDVVGILQTGAR
jgi:adenylate cyclase